MEKFFTLEFIKYQAVNDKLFRFYFTTIAIEFLTNFPKKGNKRMS